MYVRRDGIRNLGKMAATMASNIMSKQVATGPVRPPPIASPLHTDDVTSVDLPKLGVNTSTCQRFQQDSRRLALLRRYCSS